MTVITQERFSEIVLRIHLASIEGDWEEFIRFISELFDGNPVQLFGHDSYAHEPDFMVASGHDPAALEQYVTYYHSKNVWMPEIMKSKPGVARSTDEYCPSITLLNSEFYNDWVRPFDNIGVGSGVVLFKEAGRFISMGGNFREMDRFDQHAAWHDLLGKIAPHMMLALETQRIVTERTLNCAAESFLDHDNRPVFLVERNLRVRSLNRLAEDFLASGRGLRLDRAGRLQACDPGADRALRHAIEIVTNPVACASEQHLAAQQPFVLQDDPMILARASPMPPPKSEIMDRLRRYRCAPLAILALSASAIDAAPSLGALQAAYKLTKAEAHVAQSLCRGMSLKAIAESRGVSLHTARTQCKSILAKTGVQTQAQLIALIFRSAV